MRPAADRMAARQSIGGALRVARSGGHGDRYRCAAIRDPIAFIQCARRAATTRPVPRRGFSAAQPGVAGIPATPGTPSPNASMRSSATRRRNQSGAPRPKPDRRRLVGRGRRSCRDQHRDARRALVHVRFDVPSVSVSAGPDGCRRTVALDRYARRAGLNTGGSRSTGNPRLRGRKTPSG